MRTGGRGDRGASRGVNPSESVRSCKSGLAMIEEKLGPADGSPAYTCTR